MSEEYNLPYSLPMQWSDVGRLQRGYSYNRDLIMKESMPNVNGKNDEDE
jgi:hypothetical protein